MTIIYGPDAFTVGSDTDLDVYDSDWVQGFGGSNSMIITATVDWVQGTAGSANPMFWDGAGSPPGDQKISCEFIRMTGSPAASGQASQWYLYARNSYDGFDQATHYIGFLYSTNTTNLRRIYRVVDDVATILVTESNGATPYLTVDTPTSASLRVVGTGTTVDITFHIDGYSDLTYSDTSGDRILSGRPGFWTEGVDSVPGNDVTGIDNVSIDDFVGGEGGGGSDPTQMSKDQGDGQSATTGSAVAIAPQVLIRDVSNNPVQNVPVTFAVASGGGTVLPAGWVYTNASGIVSASSWTLGVVGTNTLTATANPPGITPNPVTFTATATEGGGGGGGGGDVSGTFEGKPVGMLIRPDVGTFNAIIIVSPPNYPNNPGNTPIKTPIDGNYAPGDPFVITGVTISLYQNGTSCINLAKWNVSVQYTGDVTGKTIDIYTNNRGEGNVLYIDAVLPFEEFLIPQEAYWNKPNSLRTFSVYVEETGNSSNNATSPERSIEGSVCA